MNSFTRSKLPVSLFVWTMLLFSLVVNGQTNPAYEEYLEAQRRFDAGDYLGAEDILISHYMSGGHPPSIHLLAYMAYHNLGSSFASESARRNQIHRMLTIASHRGYSLSQYFLGYLYLTGELGKKFPEYGAMWIYIASQNDYEKARLQFEDLTPSLKSIGKELGDKCINLDLQSGCYSIGSVD